MKQFSVAMLGYGIAGKAFARILNQTHDEIMKKTGYDVKVVAITTGSRGSLYCMEGIDLAEATRQLEDDGHFDVNSPIYSTMSSMEVVETVDYDAVLELTPLNIETGLPAAPERRVRSHAPPPGSPRTGRRPPGCRNQRPAPRTGGRNGAAALGPL